MVLLIRGKYLVAVLTLLLLLGPGINSWGAEEKPVMEKLSLAEVLSLARQNNRSLRVERIKERIAEQGIMKARSAFLPQLNVSVGYTWLDNPPGFLQEVTTDDGGTKKVGIVAGEEDYWSSRIALNQLICDFGARENRYQEAKIVHGMSKLTTELTTNQLLLEVTKAYFAILRSDKYQQVVTDMLRQVEGHLKIVEELFEQGMVAKNDLLEAQVHLVRVKQEEIVVENRISTAIGILNTLIGLPLEQKTELADMLNHTPVSLSLSDCIQRGLGQRLELELLGQNKKLTQHELSAIRADYFPSIFVGGGFSYDENSYTMHEEVWSVNLGLKLNLFSGGYTFAALTEANEKVLQLEEQEERQQEQIQLEVKTAYLGLKEAEKRIAVTQQAIDQAEENLRLHNNRYRYGEATSTDVLDAETLVAQTKMDYYNALYDYNVAKATLQQLMGEKL